MLDRKTLADANDMWLLGITRRNYKNFITSIGYAHSLEFYYFIYAIFNTWPSCGRNKIQFTNVRVSEYGAYY